MKVDQYRIQKAKEYSFLVPAGMSLGDFAEPQTGYLKVFSPYVLEHRDVDLETIVNGSELAGAFEDLQNDRLTVILSIPINTSAHSNEDVVG